MISTEDLTAAQLVQLDALLADTTPGGGPYRPPVARDDATLTNLESAGLVRWTEDCGFEITDVGRAVVVGRVQDLAESEAFQAFVMYAEDDELEAAIDALKLEAARYLDGDGNADLRERTLADIEACQDELERRADAQLVDGPALPVRDSGTHLDHCPVEPECVLGLNHFGLCRNARDIAARDARRAESTGRHRVVPADDRPTETIARIEQTTFEASSGTLPGLPVVESDGIPADPDEDATIRILAAIRATPSPAELADAAEATTAGWDALTADLAEQPSWLRRKLRPHRVLILSIVAAVVSTWFVAWLVMGR